ncbi:MAG: hypothetical protein ACI8UG_002749, partial [Gammaproteobacteria bacterium]
MAFFAEYIYKLVRELGKEEYDVQSRLKLTEDKMLERQQLAYKNVERSSISQIMLLLALGILGA